MAPLEHIHLADARDAPEIFSLLREGLGSRYTKFTIYQKPAIVHFLIEQIKLGQKLGSPIIYVVRDSMNILGFYMALQRGEEFFLNYVATSETSRGQGIGRMMLAHFESVAKKRGCSSLGLDVFKSNAATVDWYTRAGYKYRRSRYFIRFELKPFRDEGETELILDPEILKFALSEESQKGFSRILGSLPEHTLLLGIIGGNTCKILRQMEYITPKTVQAVARSALGQRLWLLVNTYEPPKFDKGIDAIEESLYMSRMIS